MINRGKNTHTHKRNTLNLFYFFLVCVGFTVKVHKKCKQRTQVSRLEPQETIWESTIVLNKGKQDENCVAQRLFDEETSE